MVWLFAACTLTSEPFEPSPVIRLGGELSPDESSPPSAAPDGAAGAPAFDGDGDGTAEGLGDVPLDPGPSTSEPSGVGESSGASSGSSDDEPRGDQPPAGEADAGAPPVDGEDEPEPDATPTEPPLGVACSGNEFGGSCYQFFGEAVPWGVAEQRCVAWGGHLASVESEAEDDFISSWPALLGIPAGNGSGIWLGATDASFEGDFRWWDDAQVLFDNWAIAQPDNGPGVDCIEKRNDAAALWYDRRCTDALAFVCERPL